MIVCNATPLIAFARIERLDILSETAGKIVIPDEVAKEIRNHRNTSFGAVHLEWETQRGGRAVISSGAATLTGARRK